ncbi:MAG: hypothetical protein ABIS47_13215 [Acidimicrobiales bacterium]
MGGGASEASCPAAAGAEGFWLEAAGQVTGTEAKRPGGVVRGSLAEVGERQGPSGPCVLVVGAVAGCGAVDERPQSSGGGR